MQLQESGPELLKPRRYSPSRVLSLVTPSPVLTPPGAGSANDQGRRCSGWVTLGTVEAQATARLKSRISISRDTSKSQSSLQLSAVTTEDMALYYCARDIVRGSQCEPRQKAPAGGQEGYRGAQVPPGAHSSHNCVIQASGGRDTTWRPTEPVICLLATGQVQMEVKRFISCQGWAFLST